MSNASSKNFSFIRVHPIKEWGRGDLSKSRKKWGLAGNVAHDLRFIDAPNADPERVASNRIICAKTKWKPLAATKENLKTLGIKDSNFLTEIALGIIADKGIIVKTNLVKAAMLMAAISPEYLRDGNLDNEVNPEKSRKMIEGTIAYLRKKYRDRLLMIVYHEDEQNPHLSAYVLPFIEKTLIATGRPKKGMEDQPRETRVDWRLSFSDFFRRDKRILEVDPSTNEKKFVGYERGPCTVLQDEFAEELRKHGLDVQRGIRKADEERALQYEATQERYRRLRTPPTEIEGKNFDELREWAIQAIPILTEVTRLCEERDHYQKAAGNQQRRAERLENQIAGMQRDIPVEKVIKKLTGFDPHLSEIDFEPGPDGVGSAARKRKDIEVEYLLPSGQRIGLTDKNGFENLTPEIPFPGRNAKRLKGRGAISIVKYLTDWSHLQTTEWLADTFDEELAAWEIARNFRKKVSKNRGDEGRVERSNHADRILRDLETPDALKWAAAYGKLLKNFRFRRESIEELSKANGVAVNRHGHFLFQKVQIVGADLVPSGTIVVDPNQPSIILSDIGEGVHLYPGDENLIICANPMDALSINSSPEHQGATVVVIGSDPMESTKSTVLHLIENHRGTKRLAENPTTAGMRLAGWIYLQFPGLQNLSLPTGCARWLEIPRLQQVTSVPAKAEIHLPQEK
ncbi:MAG: plasmid recombination protein [Luteolibacter sp.]